jgi:hypothetical protein
MKVGVGRVLGGLLDFVSVPYVFGKNSIMAHLNTGYYHIHGQSFVYPNHADDVLLTAGAPAWDLTGSKTEVIPANTLSVSVFDLHWINVSGISEVSEVQIDIFKGTAGNEVKIGSVRASRTTSQSRNGPAPVQIPQQVANERISCRLASSTVNATTCKVNFSGHYYA